MKDPEEAFLMDDDHMIRVVSELIHIGVAANLKPLPNGWWRIRAATNRSLQIPSPLHDIVESRRVR